MTLNPLEQHRSLIETTLHDWIHSTRGADGPLPALLREAMAYALLSGGKRARPVLALCACQALGAPPEHALPFACALEMIHAYSLVHDDLPSMDNDLIRRGKPTVHVKYGVPRAILTGDALLTEAFRITSQPNQPIPYSQQILLISLLAEAAGAAGMVGGQEYDMLAAETPPSLNDVSTLHAMKTGALFRAASLGGAIAAQASSEDRHLLETFGRNLGRAFQLIDDLLDALEDDAQDDPHERAVNLAFHLPHDDVRAQAKTLTQEALAIADHFGEHGAPLAALARLLLDRTY